MSYGDDVYSSPEKHGLQLLGEVELDGDSYSFNLFAAWTDGSNVYYATDSGCSCPSPFEQYYSRDQLAVVYTYRDFCAALADAVHRGSNPDRAQIDYLNAQAKKAFPKLFEAAQEAVNA